jgi:drug/metabolite transporter (DMT)-like permease
LGANNFLLSDISELGVTAAAEFSLSALIATTIFRACNAIYWKRKTGSFFPIEHSNFFMLDDNGERKVKWMNVLGITIRPFINMSFQVSIILAFQNATKAELNSGVITAMFATYCIFTAVFSWIFFGEKLSLKFAVGIGLMMSCVVCISASAFFGNNKLSLDEVLHTYYALGYGLLAPLLISISISVARYFTINHGYSSLSYTIDNFTSIGIIELPFFIYFDALRPYTFREVGFGIGAGFF